MEINIKDCGVYLSKDEIKSIIQSEFRQAIRDQMSSSEEVERILSNLCYNVVFKYIDEIVPNSKEKIQNNVKSIVNDKSSCLVFNKEGLASSYILQTVKENKDLINQKVKDTILKHDYSSDIWDRFRELGDTFSSSIDSIVELGRRAK